MVWRLSALFALTALAGLALAGAMDPLHTGVLTMLPAVALAVAMATRPYLGERLIARLRARRRRRPRTAQDIAGPVRNAAGVARGGRLIAVALAGRAPPLAFAGSR